MAFDQSSPSVSEHLILKSNNFRIQHDHHRCNFIVTFSKKFLRTHKRKIVLYGREVIFILTMYFLYQLTYLLVGKLYPEEAHKNVAVRNAYGLIAFEKLVGLHNLELGLQALFVQVIDNVTLMKVINAFYMGAHLPVSLFFFFHLAYCRTLNSVQNKRRKQRNRTQTVDITISNYNEQNDAAANSLASATVAGDFDHCEEKDHVEMNDKDDDDNEYQRTTNNESRPSILQPLVFLSWIAHQIGRSSNLDINSKDYKKFRWSLFLIHAMFGVTIVALPMAPPRMMIGEGYVDTIIMYTKTELTKTEERLGVNPYAAMPSLHFSYALFVGMGYFIFASQRWLRITGFIYTALVGAIIVITGNHYVMDAVIAFLYCYLCVLLSEKIVAYTSQRHVNFTLWMEETFEKLYVKAFGNDDLPEEELEQHNVEISFVQPGSPSSHKLRGSPRTLVDV